MSRESHSDPAPEHAGKPTDPDARDPLTQAESEFARELFERHRLSLYRYLKGLLHSREEASEILQETYLRLLRQPSFDRLRTNARAYLFQTATNLARDLFRQRAFRGITAAADSTTEAFAAGLAAPDWINRPDLALEGDQIAATIIDALEELAAPVREALLLHRFRDMTHREIGARMGLSTRTVERYVREGLDHIGRRLKAVL